MLTDTAVRNAKPKAKPYKLTDERGLYLLLTPSGGKLRRFKYRLMSKEKLLSLGVYPDVSLARARGKRDEARRLLADGIDPSAKRKAEKKATADLSESLRDADVELTLDFNPRLHDRAIKLDNGWMIKIGRGLDIYQKPQSWFELGANDVSLRRCLETSVDVYRQ